MWPFKKKIKNIKREEVINTIISYQGEVDKLEGDVIEDSEKSHSMLIKAAKERSIQVREMFARKIERIRKDQSAKIHRITFLNYNIDVLQKLKTAIDDQEFHNSKSGGSINRLLRNTKDLTDFLTKVQTGKLTNEEYLIGATETFTEYQAMQNENQKIYGSKAGVDDILAEIELFAGNDINENNTEKIEINSKKEGRNL